jgi:transcriptional regulator with XRE-family HTH domain
MGREQISKALKRLRENTGLTADEVGALVGKSGKTVNAWENNRGQPDAELLIKLCDIYKVNNILEEFKGAKIDNENTLLDSDRQLLLKYHILDSHGKKLVDFILNEEYERCAVHKNCSEL